MFTWIGRFLSRSAIADILRRRRSQGIAPNARAATYRLRSNAGETVQPGVITRSAARNQERAESRAATQDQSRNVAAASQSSNNLVESSQPSSVTTASQPSPAPAVSNAALNARSNIFKRLQIELERITKDPPHGCSAGLSGDSLQEWEATTPPDTVYEGGVFKLRIDFPLEYPYSPPDVKFITKIYHRNVDCSGRICIDILKQNWSPSLTMGAVLMSIVSLLADCNASDPLDWNIANKYRGNRVEHDRIARMWTENYAN